MAALTVCLCSVVEQICFLTDAFIECGGDLRLTYKHFRDKQRDALFQSHCRAAWLRSLGRQIYRNLSAKRVALLQQQSLAYVSESRVGRANSPVPIFETVTDGELAAMKRAGIDFAAIEATADAYEVIDTFAVEPSPTSKDHVDLFLCAERHHFSMTENFDDIEVVDGYEVENASYYEYLDAYPVYLNDEVPVLREGVSYTFTGYILPNCERFSINFITEDNDVALHINPRLPQNYVVRNTKARDTWGREEVSSQLPFSLHRGSKFAIQVLITDACYMISINGQHFAEYNHRLPYKEVKKIEVKGDVQYVDVERFEVTEYPDRLPNSNAKDVRLALALSQDEVDGDRIPRSFRLIRMPSTMSSNTLQVEGFPLPYYGRLPPNSIFEGRSLQIKGRVKLLPHSFYINLQQGQHIWPHPMIAFHFNPRFSKQSGAIGKAIVCRNAWYNGKWAQEERSELDTDFRPGKTFCMNIVCVQNAFEVYVNRKFITQFKHHIKPDTVDMVYIQGDIKLWDISLENSSTKADKKRIFQNPIYSEDDEVL